MFAAFTFVLQRHTVDLVVNYIVNTFIRQSAEGHTEQTIYREIKYTKIHTTQITL